MSISLPGFLDEPYALLEASAGRDEFGWSRLLWGWREEHRCVDPAGVPAAFAAIEGWRARGWSTLGLFGYELGTALVPGLRPGPAAPAGRTLPPSTGPGPRAGADLARAVAFAHDVALSPAEAARWLRGQLRHRRGRPAGRRPRGVAALRTPVSADAYRAAVRAALERVGRGDTYQVNYTFPLEFAVYGDPQRLYADLRRRQRVGYGALVVLPDALVLSFSPELFVRRRGDELVTRPMKGTAPRVPGDPAADRRQAAALAADPKNRAENVMIVDLLRSDLGRVARTGSVRVSRLCALETYQTLFQLTSTVAAQVPAGTSLETIFRALFPCGSVTGAPKRRTMEIIGELEAAPRGLYTGALGWVAPSGDFGFNVPIRTLTIDPVRGRGRLGVGSGLVAGADPEAERQECWLKARFLTELDPGFCLLESLLCRPAEGYPRRARHLARLEAAARHFGFRCDPKAIAQALEDHRWSLLAAWAPAAATAWPPHKTRLRLRKDGTVTLDSAPLAPVGGAAAAGAGAASGAGASRGAPPGDPTPGVVLAERRVDSADLFLAYKTTYRPVYEEELRRAAGRGAFDALFFNERGELAEGARSNVFLRLGERWLTPPRSAGLLPGISRAERLADPGWRAAEQTLTEADLRRAERIVLTNAVRGVVPVRLLG